MSKREYPAKINGIIYKTEEELESRIKSDSEQLALLLLDIYREKKQKERLNAK